MNLIMAAATDAQPEYGTTTTRRALAAARTAIEAEFARLTESRAWEAEQRQNARRVHLERHERLSAAVGIDPGYSADATIDAAIKQLAELRSTLSQVEGERDAERKGKDFEHNLGESWRRDCLANSERIETLEARAAALTEENEQLRRLRAGVSDGPTKAEVAAQEAARVRRLEEGKAEALAALGSHDEGARHGE